MENQKSLKSEIKKLENKQAKVLTSFIQNDVLKLVSSALIYLRNLEETSEDLLKDYSPEQKKIVEQFAAENEITANIAQDTTRIFEYENFDSSDIFKNIKKAMNQTDAKNITENVKEITKSNPLLAHLIDENRIMFEDIMNLSPRQFFMFARRFDDAAWGKALFGCSKELVDYYCMTLSKRHAAIFKEDMEFIGYMPAEEVEAQQNEIVEKMCELYEKGKLNFNQVECL